MNIRKWHNQSGQQIGYVVNLYNPEKETFMDMYVSYDEIDQVYYDGTTTIDSEDEQEMWPALFVAAALKMGGNTKNNLRNGAFTTLGLKILTGSSQQIFMQDIANLKTPPSNAEMYDAFKKNGMMIISFIDGVNKFGLTGHHAYSVKDMQYSKDGNGDHLILKLYNPWGKNKEASIIVDASSLRKFFLEISVAS